MANLAYQVTGFAYQGVGVFAYQGSVDSTDSTDVKTGTGGIDPRARRVPFKPTGLLDRPAKEARKDAKERIADAADIHAEVADRLAREFSDEPPETLQPVIEMTLAQIEREIGALLRKRIRTEEDEMLLLILIAACACR